MQRASEMMAALNGGTDTFSGTQQLVMLRQMFQNTGVLHEAQALHLRLWPFRVDPELDKADAHLDWALRPEEQAELDNPDRDGPSKQFQGEGRVRYEWLAVKRPLKWKPPVQYRAGLKALAGWVKFLLGPKWKTTVVLNGVPIFDSGDVTPSVRKKKRKPVRRVVAAKARKRNRPR